MIETPEMLDMGGVPESDAAPAAERRRPGPKPKAEIDLNAIAALIQESQAETAARIDSLTARVERAEAVAAAAGPQFVQSRVETWGNRELQGANGYDGVQDLEPGQDRLGAKQRLPISAHDGLLTADAARRMPQRFVKGQRVRINPEATRPGADKTWATVLATPRGQQFADVGQVRDCVFTGGYGWKYQVHVPGMVGARDHQDGFYESELLPA